jgi:hypothetical protein
LRFKKLNKRICVEQITTAYTYESLRWNIQG